jgi:phosphatidylinositol-3-phosphatase
VIISNDRIAPIATDSAINRFFSLLLAIILAAWGLAGCNNKPAMPPTGPEADSSTSSHTNRTVFLIVLENHNWSRIKGSKDAPYINTVLLPMAAHASQYFNPPGLHPSEPNYLWMEAGTGFGIRDDRDPAANHQATTLHLVTLLKHKGISWRGYQEDISGTDCPLVNTGLYAPKHNPMIFFDDVTDTNNRASTSCISHMRPFRELRADLQNDTVARYNFITPNLCNDMHGDPRCALSNQIRSGDDWLAHNVPYILDSPAWANGGVLFITWDEGEDGDGPIGMIVLSPNAKGNGYSNSIHYTHSSLLRTIQEIFGTMPLLGDAANAADLSDLFATFP